MIIAIVVSILSSLAITFVLWMVAKNKQNILNFIFKTEKKVLNINDKNKQRRDKKNTK